MIPGVKIGGHHCSEWNCILSSKDIGLPPERRQTLTIPGVDGTLDLTDSLFGFVPMDNRTITLTLTTLKRLTKRSWATLLSEIANAIYGNSQQIIFDDDPDWYYTGTCTISSFSTSLSKMEIVIACNCAPYKTNSTTGEKSL